jgi:hypothetical protein
MEQQPKPATKSVTIISAFIALIAELLQQIGVTVDAPGIALTINDMLVIAGAGAAIYGRVRAQGPIISFNTGRASRGDNP